MDCPRCEWPAEESKYEQDHFDCEECGCSFDREICECCETEIAVEQLQERCPNCNMDLLEEEAT